MSVTNSIEIPIRIECNPNVDGTWDVVDVIDIRDKSFLGGIGVYEFDGDTPVFPERLMDAVIKTLDEKADAFKDAAAIYHIDLVICDGGEELGTASRSFSKRQLALRTLITWDVMQTLGFGPDEKPISDVTPGYSIDFGNLQLRAGQMLNGRFVKIVSVSGVLTTAQRISEIHFELPLTVASREHLVALLTFFLYKKAGLDFEPLFDTDWLEEGKTLVHLLPDELRPYARYKTAS